MGIEKVISESRQVVGTGPVYISFDIDSLDTFDEQGLRKFHTARSTWILTTIITT